MPRDGKEIGCTEGSVRAGGSSVRGQARFHAELRISRPVWNVLASEDLLNVGGRDAIKVLQRI